MAAQWALADELAADFAARGLTGAGGVRRPAPGGRPGGGAAAGGRGAVPLSPRRRGRPATVPGARVRAVGRIGKAQEDGAAALAELMSRYVERLETRLGELKDTALTTRAEVRELRAQSHRAARRAGA
ncbi:hypothetical protein FTUN_0952 [Frigoriglobus tundricola]|uniref:Uncharacterized protein n=1 Tax=Frigoriglobus tundricola TaxID=2774151 RepID=A0A6M5YJK3_9BACT|nr:hypothetical protein FTUN_0952 [Frigoriglobus tundricola]